MCTNFRVHAAAAYFFLQPETSIYRNFSRFHGNLWNYLSPFRIRFELNDFAMATDSLLAFSHCPRDYSLATALVDVLIARSWESCVFSKVLAKYLISSATWPTFTYLIYLSSTREVLDKYAKCSKVSELLARFSKYLASASAVLFSFYSADKGHHRVVHLETDFAPRWRRHYWQGTS